MALDEQNLEQELDAFLAGRESNTPVADKPTEFTPAPSFNAGTSLLRQVIHKVVADKPEEAALDFKQYLKGRIDSMRS